jgi:glucokinase
MPNVVILNSNRLKSVRLRRTNYKYMLLGFDIGGTKCAVVIGIIEKRVILTNAPVYEMIEQLFVTAENLLYRHNATIDHIEGVGISCGGPLNSKKGIILSPPNLLGWDNIPIVEMAEKRFKRKAILQNDANACAVAEWKYGAGKGVNNMIFLTFGTGMGAGLILDGRLYSGISDLAGEVGHLRLSETGPVGFGKSGSFEGYCSGGGIAQLAQIRVREKLQVGEAVSFCRDINELPHLTAKIVAEAALSGDEVAISIYNDCAKYLGRGLSLLIDILNPELIVLGSIYVRAQSLLDPVMMDVIRAEVYKETLAACRIVPAGLSEGIGDMAALSLAILSKDAQLPAD